MTHKNIAKSEPLIKKIVFINPPIRKEQVYGMFSEWGCYSLPTGMCYIAAVLRKEGFEVAIVDGEALQLGIDGTVAAVIKEKPDIIGIACKTLWIVNADKVAEKLKKTLPHVPLVAGGHHVTALPERTLKEFPSFDLLVIGEGEYTFLELIKTLNEKGDLRNVRGLSYRSGENCIITPPRERIKDLDTLPLPAWDLLPDLMKYYQPSLLHIEDLPAFTLVTTRGCPQKCTFCDRSVFGNKVTMHSPEYIIDMIKYLHVKYGIRHLVFDDDDFLLHRSHVKRFFKLLEASGLKIKVTCSTRVDTPCLDMLPELKKSGLTQILIGVESGNQGILDAMKKNIKLDDTRRIVRGAKKAGIKVEAFIIVGYPGETEDTMKDTVKLVRELNFEDVGVWTFTPLPGAEIYSEIRKENSDLGKYEENWEIMNSMDGIVFVPKGLDVKTIDRYVMKINNECYLRPGSILKIFQKMKTKKHVKAVLNTIPKLLFGSPSRK